LATKHCLHPSHHRRNAIPQLPPSNRARLLARFATDNESPATFPSLPLRHHLLDVEPALWTLGPAGLVLSSTASFSTTVEWAGARLGVY
jgi:hypothetical protein